MVVARILLALTGCFLLSQPEPKQPCDAPHLWYAPDESGDVYFGCAPPEGWVRTPPDEHLYASPTPPPPPDTDTGGPAPTDGWVPPPGPDTSVPPPADTADTGWGVDTAAPRDTGIGGVEPPPDTGAEPIDTADTAWIDTADTGAPPGQQGTEDSGLPPVDTAGVEAEGLPPEAVPPDELPLQDDEIVIETPEGVRVLNPTDTGYWIELDELNAPR